MNFPCPTFSDIAEDMDVANERVRVANLDNRADDVLVLQGLTKVGACSMFCSSCVHRALCRCSKGILFLRTSFPHIRVVMKNAKILTFSNMVALRRFEKHIQTNKAVTFSGLRTLDSK